MYKQAQSNTETEQPDALLRGLNSYNQAIRKAHMQQVQSLPPERLLLLMREGARLYRKRYRLSSWVELCLLGAWLPIGCLMAAADLRGDLLGWSFFFVACATIGWHVCSVPWRMSRVFVDVLEHTNDLQLVGPAISMYVRPEDFGRTRDVLGKTLCRLLPQLRADHDALLTPEQMKDLLSLFGASATSTQARRDKIMLAALKALEQIGNENAIPTVRNLTMPAYNFSREVRKAAESCLEHLYINAGQHREKQTLLRASSSNAAASPDTLLRPASGSVDVAADQLLRPQA